MNKTVEKFDRCSEKLAEQKAKKTNPLSAFKQAPKPSKKLPMKQAKSKKK